MKFGFSKWCRAKRRQQTDAAWLGSSGQLTFEFLVAIIFIILIFVYGMMLFETKNNQNFVYNYQWNAQLMADRLAKNINNVYLMDNNSTYQESFYWQDSNRNVTVSEHSVLVWYNSGAFSDSPINAKLEWDITDVNGLLVFEKINDKVVVRYG
ncbi:MAG: hypothetical protein HON47_01020 [Candidatus Diapherotrites archaeon]|uniref:Uncharacterized protein n=1 Tax=Candidatus Iainarchaeum sp. TaxID=3101447 RepID=A0A8T5GEM0_9ARCH|nr:hypothetical protein [Candidatus Diapherotrites archaeon]